MNCIEDNLNNIELGIVLYNKNGSIEFTNNYVKKYLFDSELELFSIFQELKDSPSKNNFKALTKLYKDFLFLLFPKGDLQEGYILLVKEKNFFSSVFNITKYTDKEKYDFKNIIGKSPQILKVIDECQRISNNSSNILITGESGTGKEFFARAIHNNSFRKNAPFIPVNCGAIPKELIESELFGYEAGAFTGANKNGYIGKFRAG